MCCGQTGAGGRRAPGLCLFLESIEEFTDLPRCVPPCAPFAKLFGIDSGENSYESSLHLENRDCDRLLAES